jgi:hypothetical protein
VQSRRQQQSRLRHIAHRTPPRRALAGNLPRARRGGGENRPLPPRHAPASAATTEPLSHCISISCPDSSNSTNSLPCHPGRNPPGDVSQPPALYGVTRSKPLRHAT